MIGVLNPAALLANPAMTWTGQREADKLARVGRILGATMLPTGGAASSSVPVYAAVSMPPASKDTALMVGAAVLGLAAVAAVVYKMRKKKKR